MAKKIVGFIKLQIPAGKANPSPPVGPALGQRGLNIMEFCKAFNAQTQSLEPGLPIPVVITAYADKSFTFIMKTPRSSLSARCRSPRIVQHTQPLLSSMICSSLSWTSNSLSMLSGPNSFSITAMRCPWFSESKRLSKVVLPAPRKPVRMVTGTILSIFNPVVITAHNTQPKSGRP